VRIVSYRCPYDGEVLVPTGVLTNENTALELYECPSCGRAYAVLHSGGYTSFAQVSKHG